MNIDKLIVALEYDVDLECFLFQTLFIISFLKIKIFIVLQLCLRLSAQVPKLGT